jgi:hypothetical protein
MWQAIGAALGSLKLRVSSSDPLAATCQMPRGVRDMRGARAGVGRPESKEIAGA